MSLNKTYNEKHLPSFYFAGKISATEDWREPLLAFPWSDWGWEAWITKERGVLNTFDYIGPYFQNLQINEETPDEGFIPHRIQTVGRRLRAIEQCDILFAWITEANMPETLLEIGYARGLKETKQIWIGVDKNIPWDQFEDLWFLRCIGHAGNPSFSSADSPKNVFFNLLKMHNRDGEISCESPIELQFWQHAKFLDGIRPQFSIAPYRLDFAFPKVKLGIPDDQHASIGSDWDIPPCHVILNRPEVRQEIVGYIRTRLAKRGLVPNLAAAFGFTPEEEPTDARSAA